MEVVEEQTEQNAEKIGGLEMEIEALKEENKNLRGDFIKLRLDVDEQTDRGLRDHVTFFGIKPTKEEKTWQDTLERLAGWLAEKTGKDAKYFDDAIYRCHRGGVPNKPGSKPIYCKLNWRVAEQVRDTFKFKNTDGVTIKDMYSKGTQARLNDALVYRKDWKRRYPSGKAFIQYPATVRCKRVTDTSYYQEKVF